MQSKNKAVYYKNKMGQISDICPIKEGEYVSNKKYYWLKLKEDFFEEDTISWIEEQENGKEYDVLKVITLQNTESLDDSSDSKPKELEIKAYVNTKNHKISKNPSNRNFFI